MNTLHDRPIEALDRTCPIPWAAFKTELLALYQPPMVSKPTKTKLTQVLRELEAIGTLETTADLTPVLVASFIRSRPPGQSTHTLHSLTSVVRTVCAYAESAGYLRVSPFRLRRLSRWVGPLSPPGNGKKRHCTRAEIKTVWDLAAHDVATRQGWAQWRARRIQACFCIASLMGLRRNELLGSRVADVDLQARIFWIRPNAKRGLKTRAAQAPLPIPDALVPILESWLAHRMDAPYGFALPTECPWLIPTVSRKAPWIHGSSTQRALARLHALARRAGVDGMTFQVLRRSCATHLEAHGVGRATIKRLLRHTTERMSEEFYSETDLPNLTSAVEGFAY
jgi:integrase